MLPPIGAVALVLSVVLNIHFGAPQTVAWSFYQQRAFKASPCTIQSCRTTDLDPPDDLILCYTYERDGITYTSRAYMPELPGISTRRTRDEAVAIIRAYPQGKQALCYVSIQDPAQAVLIKHIGWRRILTALVLVGSMLIGPLLITRGFLRLAQSAGRAIS